MRLTDRQQSCAILALWLGIIVFSYLKWGVPWGLVIGLWPGSFFSLVLVFTADYFRYRNYYLGHRNILPEL